MTASPSDNEKRSPPIRVLAADDQRVVREGLAMLLGLLPDVEVVGTAADGHEALRLAEQTQPDVVLMDLRMPHLDGAAATRQLRDRCPDVQVIVLTTYADDRSVIDALRAGARGYLTKDAGAEEIRRALHDVTRGRAVIDPAVQSHLVDAIAAPPSPTSPPVPDPSATATPSVSAPGIPGTSATSDTSATPPATSTPPGPVPSGTASNQPGYVIPSAPAPSGRTSAPPGYVAAAPASASPHPAPPATPDAQVLARNLGLTPREGEVLALIAEGLSNAEIADRLVVSEATVKSHVNHLLGKISVRGRAQAVSVAYQHGLPVPGPHR